MLQKDYPVTVDMEVKNFCGLKFDCNYDNGYVNNKIPNYVSDALYSFQHTPTSQPKYYPYAQNPFSYE